MSFISDAHIKDLEPLEFDSESLEEIHPVGVPAVLLPYQQEWVADKSEVAIQEKGRRTGLTWGQASDDVLIAATEKSEGGMDVLYLGYELEMTREYITTCAFWAKNFASAIAQINSCEQFIFEDYDPKTEETREIKAFRINFASGNKIVALSSAPRSIRGRQGRVVIDEAAFHDDLKEVIKSALALLMWGGQVRIISTHNGEDNYFNQLIQETKAGKWPYSRHFTPFAKAVEQGLYKRICLTKKKEWTPEVEEEWVDKIRKFYGDNAEEELDGVPSKSSEGWLTMRLIESCVDPLIPVFRWTSPADDFVDWKLEEAEAEVENWLEDNLAIHLEALPQSMRHYFGGDFARSGDVSVYWPLTKLPNGHLHTPFVLEVKLAPFRSQQQMICYIIDRLPRFSGGALDARGNGQETAERIRQHYGPDLIHEVMANSAWYDSHMPRILTNFEDRTFTIPDDKTIKDDFWGTKKIKGIPRIPATSRKTEYGARHYDAVISVAMAMYAEKVIIPPKDWEKPITAGTFQAAALTRGFRL